MWLGTPMSEKWWKHFKSLYPQAKIAHSITKLHFLMTTRVNKFTYEVAVTDFVFCYAKIAFILYKNNVQ